MGFKGHIMGVILNCDPTFLGLSLIVERAPSEKVCCHIRVICFRCIPRSDKKMIKFFFNSIHYELYETE